MAQRVGGGLDRRLPAKIHNLELQIGRLSSHMTSEFGDDNSMGNIPKSINRISFDIAELKRAFDG